ncbi:hypothetical protein GCM10028803_51470 [Larkinella knui]|uniref:Glycosyltransferase RgtA/B/C/D-like domain-containing protein n=1 Tax=Larkinella knui TaxID=2025310 RepID=A0A3P1CH02_9BACT|nr:hypothetical protein [Larkinella knui]RRB12633.1 hypothetical protein EHT87_20815 [Larkinella knui]
MLSFDSNPLVFLGIGYGLLWLTGALAISPAWLRPNTVWRSPKLFLIIALGSVVFMRLPVVVFNQELNPDESQIIAQGLTLSIDPVFWRSVDGTTGGPLDSYLLIIPSWLGLSFDYISARITGLILIISSLWLLFQTLKRWFGEEVARWALMPSLILLAMTQNGDLVHYSSEHLPIFLLSLLYYGYARLQQEPIPAQSQIFLVGLVAGMVPFGKLQAVPMMFCVGLFVTIDLLTRPNLTVRQKTSRFLWLMAGGISFPLLVVALTSLTGVFDDMVTFYIVANFNYGAGDGHTTWDHLLRLPAFFRRIEEFNWFIWLSVLLGFTFLVFLIRNQFRLYTNWKVWLFLVCLIGFILIAITRTGSEYTHYLLFLIGPIGLLNAWFLSEIRYYTRNRRWVATRMAAVVLAAALIPYGVRYVNRGLNRMPLNDCVQNSRKMPQSAVTQRILQYAKPGEKLAVWGWMCKYYVEAQMPQGVNENHTIRSAFNHPMRDVYRQRYLADLRRSKPPVFIDAVGQSLWLNDRATQAHESFGALRDLIAANYRFAGEIDKTRIYVRADRYKQPITSTNSYVD